MKSSQSKITERHKNIWKTEATSISEKKKFTEPDKKLEATAAVE